jgi:hypothetical protein
MEIEAFAERERFFIKTWHQDIQTGARADALQQRPGLAAGIQEAQTAKCPLIVSRLRTGSWYWGCFASKEAIKDICLRGW